MRAKNRKRDEEKTRTHDRRASNSRARRHWLPARMVGCPGGGDERPSRDRESVGHCRAGGWAGRTGRAGLRQVDQSAFPAYRRGRPPHPRRLECEHRRRADLFGGTSPERRPLPAVRRRRSTLLYRRRLRRNRGRHHMRARVRRGHLSPLRNGRRALLLHEDLPAAPLLSRAARRQHRRLHAVWCFRPALLSGRLRPRVLGRQRLPRFRRRQHPRLFSSAEGSRSGEMIASPGGRARRLAVTQRIAG